MVLFFLKPFSIISRWRQSWKLCPEKNLPSFFGQGAVRLARTCCSNNDVGLHADLGRRLSSRDQDNEDLKLPVSLRCVGPGVTPLQVEEHFYCVLICVFLETIILCIINVNLDFICRSFPQVLASISTHLHVSKDPALGQVTWFNSIGLVLLIGKLLWWAWHSLSIYIVMVDVL